MNLPPNLYVAALGPLIELIGVVVIVTVFALLRGQADRRPYFRAWERAWVFFAASLTAGLFYDRFVNPDSVFYPTQPLTSRIAAAIYFTFLALAAAMYVRGTQLYVRGASPSWLPKVAIALGIAVTFLVDTTQVRLEALWIVHGPLEFVAYAYAAVAILTLPGSRQSTGTRFATLTFALLAVAALELAAFYMLQRTGAAITGNPWLVRIARYEFYGDLLLRFGLAFSMVRMLIEDGRREADDTRAHLKLVQDRDKLGDLYDPRVRLLGRRAFDALVGLDFARASFGSVARFRIANFARVADQHGPAVAEALLAHVAGVLDSAVRAHDRVYRWGPDELLIVMPRAVPAVARERIEFLAGRAAPLAAAGVREPVRAEPAIAVAFYRGGDELAEAASAVSRA